MQHTSIRKVWISYLTYFTIKPLPDGLEGVATEIINNTEQYYIQYDMNYHVWKPTSITQYHFFSQKVSFHWILFHKFRFN